MSLWDNTKLTEKLTEGGDKISKVYQIGKKGNKTHKISVVLSDAPLKPLMQIGTSGTRYSLEQYKNKPRLCSNCKHWGHYSTKCRRQTQCNNCGGKHKGVCKRLKPECAQCHGPHRPKSPTCPATIREYKIITEMELRQIDYKTARKNNKLTKP
ncbi:hypothetical protein ACJMK2_016515 [Sinanodonta woodiana]|uniref:Gag-like protein n=1 Tax=Sinanodonta woodiana TaxID=1069815 RepID=A0ABD3UTU4_SINWO